MFVARFAFDRRYIRRYISLMNRSLLLLDAFAAHPGDPVSRALSGVLESAGARVTTAYSAAQVLTLIDAEPPDVLVSDLGMPQMDGFELIDLLRRHDNPRVRATPAAALTAYARSEDRVKALSAGFQMHLAKPIEPAELVITVAALVQRIPA